MAAVAEDLLQRDRFSLGDGDERARAVDDPLPLQVPHAAPQHFLRPQAGDGQIGLIDPDGDGLPVGNENTVVRAFDNGVQAVVGLLEAPEHPGGLVGVMQKCGFPVRHGGALPSQMVPV